MRKFLIGLATICCLFGGEVYAQTNAQNVSAYFYPLDEEVEEYSVMTKDNRWGFKTNFLFAQAGSGYRLVTQQVDLIDITGITVINEGYEELAVSKNKIETTQNVNDNFLFGRTVNNNRRTLLLLPQIGNSTTITQVEDQITYNITFSLVALTVDLDGERQDINVIKVVKKTQYRTDAGVDPSHTEYWGKDMGRIFMILSDKAIFARSTRLTGSYYKEKPYYDVDEMKRRQKEQEQQRLERERQEKVDAFLAARENTIYQMEVGQSVYTSNDKVLKETVGNIVQRSGINQLDLHVTDDLTLSYNGVAQHNINITGLGSDNAELVNALKNAMMQAKLTPITQTEPASKKEFTVTSRGVFTIGYSRDNQTYDLSVIKQPNSVRLKKGDAPAFNDSENYLASNLLKRGRYDLVLNVDNICGTKDRNHTVKDFCRPIGNIFFEYSYSQTAPLGLTLGLNQIGYTNMGVYVRYKSAVRKAGGTDFKYLATHPKKDGYIRDAFTGGITVAILKNLYLYGGAGYGDCSVAYSNAGDDYTDETVYYRASTIKGLEVELGARWRIWKFIGVSAGYSAILPLSNNKQDKRYFGDVNFGLALFF